MLPLQPVPKAGAKAEKASSSNDLPEKDVDGAGTGPAAFVVEISDSPASTCTNLDLRRVKQRVAAEHLTDPLLSDPPPTTGGIGHAENTKRQSDALLNHAPGGAPQFAG
jgi:hypothetical protein